MQAFLTETPKEEGGEISARLKGGETRMCKKTNKKQQKEALVYIGEYVLVPFFQGTANAMVISNRQWSCNGHKIKIKRTGN